MEIFEGIGKKYPWTVSRRVLWTMGIGGGEGGRWDGEGWKGGEVSVGDMNIVWKMLEESKWLFRLLHCQELLA